MARAGMSNSDYETLADFRYALRQFLAFSQAKAVEAGLTPQQYQALVAIRGATVPVTIGYVAERLILKPNSASGLVDRLESLGYVQRRQTSEDRRRTLLGLTEQAEALLSGLAQTHRAQLVQMRPLLTDLLDRLG